MEFEDHCRFSVARFRHAKPIENVTSCSHTKGTDTLRLDAASEGARQENRSSFLHVSRTNREESGKVLMSRFLAYLNASGAVLGFDRYPSPV
jgi:hypothetical protein